MDGSALGNRPIAMTKSDQIREAFSDLSKAEIKEIEHAYLNMDTMTVGRIIEKAIEVYIARDVADAQTIKQVCDESMELSQRADARYHNLRIRR